MFVCAHGNVRDFCKARGMTIIEEYRGQLESYRGVCRVIVTDEELSNDRYSYLKGLLLGTGYELISVSHSDEELFTWKNTQKQKSGGRQKFGFYYHEGELKCRPESLEVVKQIYALRAIGVTLREIAEHPEVHHPNGRKMSISTIQQVIKNRKLYEDLMNE